MELASIGYAIISTIRIYQFILFIKVIMSWSMLFGINLYSSRIYMFLSYLTEPVLNIIRRYIPSFIGFFDLSVLWLFLLTEILIFTIGKLFGLR